MADLLRRTVCFSFDQKSSWTLVQSGMHLLSALLPKADVCGHWHVGLVGIISFERPLPPMSLPQVCGIESRITSRGNQTPSGCQASEDVALTGDDCLTMLRRISLTPAHNIMGRCNASSGKFFSILFETFEHVVCSHWHTAALVYKLLAARSPRRSALCLSNVEVGGRDRDDNRRDGTIANSPFHHVHLPD